MVGAVAQLKRPVRFGAFEQAGAELVAGPAVSARMEVAARAGCLVVTADAGIPEQRLAELNGGVPVGNELVKNFGGRAGHRNGF